MLRSDYERAGTSWPLTRFRHQSPRPLPKEQSANGRGIPDISATNLLPIQNLALSSDSET